MIVRLALLLALAVPGTAAAATTPAVVVFNLTAEPKIEPARVFLQADAGPYLDALRWSGWGSPTATGTGTWVLDCSSGGPSCGASTAVERHPARYVLTGLVACPRFGAGAQTYRVGTIAIDRDGRTDTVRLHSETDHCAPRPSHRAARAAVARFLRARRHADPARVRCRSAGATDLECRARWRTSSGAVKRGRFFVFARLDRPPLVRPVG
jgi:hypothetical protein